MAFGVFAATALVVGDASGGPSNGQVEPPASAASEPKTRA
jgi:hypothetical protein